MEKSLTSPSQKNSLLLTVATILSALLMYHLCYGFQTLNPYNIDWLMSALHDWGTHYLGWHFFKNEPWQFPLGNISNYFAPLGTNVGFTDSIPLLAIFFKLFSAILPENFQYFGVWLLACQLLAAYYTIRLFNRFRVHEFITFLAVIFIMANPVFLYRTLHPALCGQWLLIGSIYLYFRDPANANRSLTHQFILLIVSALVNPYLCLMVLGFSFILPVKLAFYDKAISRARMILYLAITFASLIATWYLIGMITFGDNQGLVVQGGFGLYALNLNSLYNASGFSTFLPAFNTVSWHQYEGFMYLGAGIFLLLLILLFYRATGFLLKRGVRNTTDSIRKEKHGLVPLYVLIALLTLFAVTHVITFNDKVLFTVPIPEIIIKLGDTFRASARFFWPVYYLIILFCLIGFSKTRMSMVAKMLILVITLCVQLYDSKRLIAQYHRDYQYSVPIRTQEWESLINEFDEIAFVPPFTATNLLHMDYQYFCYMAAKARKPINTGYVARSDSRATQNYLDSLQEKLNEGRLSPRTLYITTDRYLYNFSVPLQADSCRLNMLDGYYFLYSTKNNNKVVQQLSEKFNASNKLKLDSAIQSLPRRTYFVRTSAIDTSKQGTQHFMSTFKKTKTFLIVQGWAFLENTNSNKGDSIYVVLNNDQHSYIAPTISQKRPDVTSHFKKEYLDDAGYFATIFTDSVEKGNYQLGVLIRDKNGNLAYCPTDKNVEVNLPEFNHPQKINTAPDTGDIQYGLDYFHDEKDLVSISGWSAFRNQDSDSCTVGLMFKSGDQVYVADTYTRMRPDVTAHFNGKYKLDNSGFVAKVLKTALPKGEYQVGLIIIDKKRGKEGLIYIDKEIKIM